MKKPYENIAFIIVVVALAVLMAVTTARFQTHIEGLVAGQNAAVDEAWKQADIWREAAERYRSEAESATTALEAMER